MDLSFIPTTGGITWTIIAFIVTLSIIVAIHEYGHYIVGRWCGIKADVFSIGFGPVIWARTDKRGTQWQLAALPLGGYVKFKGDSNASSAGDDGTISEMSAEERETTMNGARLWKRTLTVIAGPLFNFITAILIFAAFFMIEGDAVDAPIVGELRTLPEGIETLQTGDRILAINDVAVTEMDDLSEEAGKEAATPLASYVIERDGAELTVDAAWPLLPAIDRVSPRSAAIDAGLKVGDYILAVDGAPIHNFEALRQKVLGSDGAELELTVWRAGGELTVSFAPKRQDIPLPEGGFETRWLIGITGGLFFEPVTETVGPFAAVWRGAQQTSFMVRSSLSAIWYMIAGQISTCNLSGPIGIAEASADSASLGFEQFVWFIAALSVAIGMFNLFPVPVLDGGHLVFYAYEAVRGKPPSPKAVNLLVLIGLAFMGSLMLFGLSRDLLCP